MRTAYIVAPEADAADAVQDGFLKAYAALPRFRADAPFRPWLLRIVANEARNRRRSADRRAGLAIRAAARSGGDTAIADSPESFAESCALLLTNDKQCAALSSAARTLAEERFDARNISERLGREFRSFMTDQRGVRGVRNPARVV